MPSLSTSPSPRSTPHRSPARRIRLLLVDDHSMARQALRNHIVQWPDIELVGEAADGEEAVRLTGKLSPDVVVMDIRMPRMNGIEATGLIVRAHPSVSVIGLSFETGTKKQEALLKAGARTVLDKGAACERLYHAISQVVGKRIGSSQPGCRS